jgi:hypothetical protein
MPEFRDKASQLVRTAQRIASLRGASEEGAVLAQSEPTLIETGYDNWASGTTFYTLTLEIPIELYVRLEEQRDALEKSIGGRMSELTRAESGSKITEVVISPKLAEDLPSTENHSEESPDPVPSFWAAGHFRLFVSHVATAKKGAHDIKAALAAFQVAAFIAHEDIEPNKEWQPEIESALRTMDALTAIITPDFIMSKWCDQEVGFAIGRGKLVVPLRAGADPHGFLGKYQARSVENLRARDIAHQIFDILATDNKSRARMADALVERLCTSASWEMSRQSMGLLEQVPSMNREQVARLVRAIDENDHVRDAYTVPARITALVGRIGQPDAVTG